MTLMEYRWGKDDWFLMPAALIVSLPLAFGVTARAWCRQWKRFRDGDQQWEPAGGDVESTS
jgi:hypothetical protein